MFFANFLNKRNEFEIKEIQEFLKKHDVEYDNPEETVIIRDAGKIIGTGSVDGRVLKYLFIDENYKGQGLMVKIYDELLNYLLSKNELSYFIFTSPHNENIFSSLGLKKIISTDKVLLLEGGFNNYSKWINDIKKELNEDAEIRGAIVANCNPMTLGHKYLIDYARSQVDELIVFIVEEDRSFFSTKDRFSIVKNEYKNDNKVKVVLGGPYIISQATFPTYFLKEVDKNASTYTELDARIFVEKISKDLNISVRFLGEEPNDILTDIYNKNLLKTCEDNNFKIQIIERKKDGEKVISASRVRELLESGEIDKALELVPKSTKEFIIENYKKDGDVK